MDGILGMAKMGGKILRRELFLSFSPILMKFGTDVCLGNVDVQDTFFDSGRKCVAMVTGIMAKMGEKSCSELLPQFFNQFS